MSRLLNAAVGAEEPDAVRARLAREARAFFRTGWAALLSVARNERRIELIAASPTGDGPEKTLDAYELPAIRELIERGPVAVEVGGEGAARLAASLGQRDARAALVLPMHSREGLDHVLVLGDPREREFSESEIGVAAAFAAAASASLAQLRAAEEHAGQIATQEALARAAKALTESLDLNRVLVRICEEAARILAAETAAVYVGNGSEGLRIAAACGMPAEAIGLRLAAGEGLAGKVAAREEPLLTNDYQGMTGRPALPYFDRFTSAVAVPMRWNGELHGVLSVGFQRPHVITRDHLGLLEAFGELAAAACRNASAHAGLAITARTDSLTGCLNRATLHEAIRREFDRSRRTGQDLSLALLDLDDFKQVNERHGHLVGDEVLRRVGRALRQTVRSYDVVARYGGDEFVIVAAEAGEREAAEVANRAIARVSAAVSEFGAGAATAGVAQWNRRESATSLIERADRALLYAKQNGGKGRTLAAAEVPDGPYAASGD